MTVRSDALNKSQGANRLGSRFSLVMLFIIVTGYGRIKVRARRCNHTYFSKVVMHHLLDALLSDALLLIPNTAVIRVLIITVDVALLSSIVTVNVAL
jgi:hypothetical protein